MKIVLKFFKIVTLTILTFGLYGAYWTFTTLCKDDNDLDDSGEYKRGGQVAAALTWFRPYMK